MAAVRLADYRPAACLLKRTDLTVELHADHALVHAQLSFLPNPAAAAGEPLLLRGVELELLSLHLNGAEPAVGVVETSAEGLLLRQPPAAPFTIST